MYVLIILGIVIFLICRILSGIQKDIEEADKNKQDSKEKEYIFVGEEGTPPTKSINLSKTRILREPYYECPQCGQPCSEEEYEAGYCLDCDQIEMDIE